MFPYMDSDTAIKRPNIDIEALTDQGLVATVSTVEAILNRWDLQILGSAAFIEDFLEDLQYEAQIRGLLQNGRWLL